MGDLPGSKSLNESHQSIHSAAELRHLKFNRDRLADPLMFNIQENEDETTGNFAAVDLHRAEVRKQMTLKGLQQKTQRKNNMQFQIKKSGTLKMMNEKARASGYGRDRRESAFQDNDSS